MGPQARFRSCKTLRGRGWLTPRVVTSPTKRREVPVLTSATGVFPAIASARVSFFGGPVGPTWREERGEREGKEMEGGEKKEGTGKKGGGGIVLLCKQ